MINIHIMKRVVFLFLIFSLILTIFCACSQNGGSLGSPSAPTSSEVPSAISSLSTSLVSSAPLPTATPSQALDSDVKMEQVWYYYNMLDASGKKAYKELYDAIQSWVDNSENTQPFLYELKCPGATVDGDEVLTYMKWDNPIIAQYFNGIDINNDNDSIVFTDTDEQSVFGSVQNVRQMIQDVETAADAFLSGLSPSMSDRDKYWYIAKKLCEETTFDYAFPQVPMRQFLDDSGVYGALVNRLGVCQGFAQTYDYLCKRAGLFSLVVSGNTYSGDHAWNIVKLDDGYYHVDATWMQSNQSRYFCLTDEQVAVDHTIISQYHPECDGSQYAFDGGKIPSEST